MSAVLEKTVWRTEKLDAISECIDYGLTASSTPKQVGPKFLRITDVQNGVVNWDEVPYCKCSDDEKERNALTVGDIVFARTGATTGKSFLIRDCPIGSVFASYLIRVRPNKEIFPPYLARFFDTPNYWSQITRSSTGSTQPGVNSTKLKELKVPFPKLSEQKRIAGILDKADAIRHKRQQAIDVANKLSSSLFFDVFGDPIRNPKNWKIAELKDICNQITDGVHYKPTYVDSGVPFISVKDITTGQLVMDKCKFISEEAHEKLIQRCKPEYLDILTRKLARRMAVPPSSIRRNLSAYTSAQP